MLNENIRRLRLAKGASQVELATALGVTKQSISNWENDNIQPSVEMLVKLAQYFSVTTDYLLGISSEKQLDISGLDDEAAAHIAFLVHRLRR